MAFDDLYMERSKGFVKALQELKNLQPQLYSAADYCEKTYLLNEQKQMVLDNLKDYVVRALVNAVDHLGTVAYKLTDLSEQQTSEISNVELKISCLNQQILVCQSYCNKEGLQQQQMLPTGTRHHKHYILPNSVTKREENTSKLHHDGGHVAGTLQPHSPGTSGTKTLSWLLSSDAKSATCEAHPIRVDDSKFSKVTSDVFHLLEAEEPRLEMPLSTHLQAVDRSPTYVARSHRFGVKEQIEVQKSVSGFKAFTQQGSLQVYRPPAHTKSMISAFFSKNKTFKSKKVLAS